MDQRERVRSLGRSGNRAAVRQLDSALSQAAGNGTFSLLGSCEDAGIQRFRDSGMQGATGSRAEGCSEAKKQQSKLPFSSLHGQELQTQIKLQTCKAGRGFPAGRFPCHAIPVVFMWTA